MIARLLSSRFRIDSHNVLQQVRLHIEFIDSEALYAWFMNDDQVCQQVLCFLGSIAWQEFGCRTFLLFIHADVALLS